MGMTDEQFQAMLYDELEIWEQTKKTAEKEHAVETVEIAQRQIDKINLKLNAS